MKNMLKDIPAFESEDEEHEFWATHDSTEYIAWGEASPANFNLGWLGQEIADHAVC